MSMSGTDVEHSVSGQEPREGAEVPGSGDPCRELATTSRRVYREPGYVTVRSCPGTPALVPSYFIPGTKVPGYKMYTEH
eukprot:928356-Rhodomonas_salina.2